MIKKDPRPPKSEEKYFIESNKDLRDIVVRHITNSKLADLIIETMSYYFFIPETALRDLLQNKDNSDSHFGKLPKQFAFTKKPLRRYESNIGNLEWNREMQSLLSASLVFDKERKSKDIVTQEEIVFESPKNQVKKEYIPRYSSYRKKRARGLKRKYQVRLSIFDEIYQEIQKLIRNKEKLSQEKLETLRFLERDGICFALPNLFEDLGRTDHIKTLKQLRMKSKTSNTACYHCGQVILKKTSNNFCSQSKNRRCYSSRVKKDQEKIKENKFVLSNKKCRNCFKDADYNYTHKIKRNPTYFCSDTCHRTYKKKLQRASKPN